MSPPLPPLVDTHAHLDNPRLRDDLPGVLARAASAGVVQAIAIATTAGDSREVVALAGANPGIFASVGVHPNDAAEASPGDWDAVVALARSSRVVAIGETGLDRHWDRTPIEVQRDWFARHVELARATGLPLVIHCREAEADILAQLRALGRSVSGVLHSVTAGWADARGFLDLGLHLSFAGMLTFANRSLDPLREVAALAPLDRILVETDSPYLSPVPYRGKPNEPARVVHTAARLAEVRGLTLEALAAATTANARRLFGLPEADLIAPTPAPG